MESTSIVMFEWVNGDAGGEHVRVFEVSRAMRQDDCCTVVLFRRNEQQ